MGDMWPRMGHWVVEVIENLSLAEGFRIRVSRESGHAGSGVTIRCFCTFPVGVCGSSPVTWNSRGTL